MRTVYECIRNDRWRLQTFKYLKHIQTNIRTSNRHENSIASNALKYTRTHSHSHAHEHAHAHTHILYGTVCMFEMKSSHRIKAISCKQTTYISTLTAIATS